jgi:hypothetical protein
VLWCRARRIPPGWGEKLAVGRYQPVVVSRKQQDGGVAKLHELGAELAALPDGDEPKAPPPPQAHTHTHTITTCVQQLGHSRGGGRSCASR